MFAPTIKPENYEPRRRGARQTLVGAVPSRRRFELNESLSSFRQQAFFAIGRTGGGMEAASGRPALFGWEPVRGGNDPSVMCANRSMDSRDSEVVK